MKHIKLFEEFVNESEEYVGYIELERGKQLLNSFKDMKSAMLWKKKNEDDLLDKEDVEKVGIMPKKEWDSKEAKYAIKEAIVNEASVKQFESDYKEIIKHIKSGFGWIDPDYVQETWENTSDIDFEIIKTELYKRLIKDNLLWFATSDGEQKDKQVKSLKEIGIKESLVNEAFDVTVSFRHVKDAIALFNDMFTKYGKKPSTDVFSFKQKDAAIDFVQMLVKNLQIPMGEIKADDTIIKNLK